jgi:hypothetical protein
LGINGKEQARLVVFLYKPYIVDIKTDNFSLLGGYQVQDLSQRLTARVR